MTHVIKNAIEPFQGGNMFMAENFLRDCQTQFTLNPTQYPDNDPRKQILYALTQVQGPAVQEWKHMAQEECSKKPKATWEEFETLFKSFWVTPRGGSQNKTYLINFKWKKGWTAKQFILKFKLAAIAANEQANPLLPYMFKQALPKTVFNELSRMNMEMNMIDQCYEALQKMAGSIQIASGIRDYRGERKTSGELNSYVKGSHGYQGVPMDINWVELKEELIQYVKLNDAERKKLMAENRCFKCKKKGHQANKCWGGKKEKKKWEGKIRRMEEHEEEEEHEERKGRASAIPLQNGIEVK